MENKPYELELVPIKIKDTRIELWAVKRWKEVVEAEIKDETEYITHFPLWIKIWEASIVLSEHIANGIIEKDAKILELGAGMGLTGIVLGGMGYHVTITDYNEDALALLKKNMEHNNLKNVYVKKLDWSQPDLEESYDIILGSEIIYKQKLIEPLLDLFQKYLKQDGTIFMAHDVNRQNMTEFLNKAEKFYYMQKIEKTMRSESDIYRIVIHTFHKK